MVYTKITNRKVKSFVITCDCGCGNGLEFKVLGNEVFVSGLSGNFYTYQSVTGILKNKARYLYNHLRRKKTYMCDCCLSDEDIKDFLYSINNLDIEDDAEDTVYENDSKLMLYKDKIFDDIYCYGIYIKPLLDTRKYLLGKDYRAQEVIYSKKEWQRFVRACNKFLEK